MGPLSWNLRASASWNPQDLSRAVMGLLYLYLMKCHLSAVISVQDPYNSKEDCWPPDRDIQWNLFNFYSLGPQILPLTLLCGNALYHNTDRSQPISHYPEVTERCPMDCYVTAQEFPVSAYCYITFYHSGEFQPFQIVFSEGYHYEHSCGQCDGMNGGEGGCSQVRWCRSANGKCRQQPRAND
jgi:hypothetical protein